MLNPDRKKFVTASQAHRVMAKFEGELAGRLLEKPTFPDYDKLVLAMRDFDKAPLVRELKNIGITATGKEIEQTRKYIKAQVPVFSEGMESVAIEMSMSQFVEIDEDEYLSEDMRRGNDQEAAAVAALSRHIGVEFTSTGEDQQFLSIDNIGVTPDGVEYDGFNIKSCAEVKAPKAETHMKYLYRLTTQESLLKYVPEYYWQCQTGLAVTGADVYHFAAYNARFKGKYQLVYIPVVPVQEHIDILKERAERVVDAVPGIVETIIRGYGE